MQLTPCTVGMYLLTLISDNVSPSSNDLGLNPDGSAVNPEAFRQQIQRDSNLMAQLFQVLYMHSNFLPD